VAGERLDTGVLDGEQPAVDFTSEFDRHRVPLALRRAEVRARRAFAGLQPPQDCIARFSFVETEPRRHISDLPQAPTAPS
jgi:hypothetical protein